MIQILNNQYPIGWEWIDNIPLSQMKFFYDLMATVTDNTDIYDYYENKYPEYNHQLKHYGK